MSQAKEQQGSACYNLGFVAGPMAGGGALRERQRRGKAGAKPSVQLESNHGETLRDLR